MKAKKVLASLLAFAMVLSMFSVAAFAQNEETDAVAEVNGVKYSTLAAAIEAANELEDATVTLLRDYDMEANEPGYGYTTSYVSDGETTPRNNMIVLSGNGLTFDLGGFTLSNLFNNTFAVTGTNVTIQNGTMNLGQLYYGSYSTKKGVTLYAAPTYGSYVVYVNGAQNFTVNNLKTFGGINVAGGATATINDLSFSGLSFYAVCSQEGSNVTLNGGNYNKAISGAANYLFWVESGSVMNIVDGTYSKGSTKFINGINPVITGGTFDFDPTNNGVAEGYEVIDNENGTWTVTAEAVATVNGVKYSTLAAAIEAANELEDATVTLLRDYDMEANEPGYGWTTLSHSARENMIEVSGAGLTFDLGGYTLSNIFNNTFKVTGENVTIKNGEMRVANYTNGDSGSYVIMAVGATNLTIDELTTYGGINIAGGSTATINDLAFSGTLFYAVCSQENSAVTIVGGTFNKAIAGSTRKLFWIEAGSTMNITGGTFNIEGNSANFLNGKVKPVITGGTFDFDPTNNGVAEGYEVIDNGNGTWTVAAEKVAEVNGVGYASIEEAIEAAEENGTVDIIKDFEINDTVSITKSLTINGNNHTVTANKNTGNYAFYVYEPESDPVTVSVSNLDIVSSGFQTAILLNSGESSVLNLDNVDITSDGECIYSNGVATVNAVDCALTHTGTYLTGKDAVYYSAVLVGYSGVVNLTDCTVYSTDYAVSTFPSGGTINLYNTNVTVEETEATYVTAPAAIWVRVDKGYNHSLAVDSCVNVYGTSEVTGALKVTNTSIGTQTERNTALVVYGGTYTVDPAEYVAEGYESVDNANDTWTVVAEAVAEVNGVKYATLAEAVAAANDGDTITVIADFAISEDKTNVSDRIVVNKSVTIDFGEYTMTVPGSLEPSDNWVALYVSGEGTNVTVTATTGGIDCADKADGDKVGNYVFYVQDGATLTVNGGNYHGGGTVAQVRAGEIVLNGGNFSITDFAAPYDGYRYLLNCVDANYNDGTGKITVKGGTFENFDPADCLAEGANTNFVAEGYESVALAGGDAGKYQVGLVQATEVAQQETNEGYDATFTATKQVVSTDGEATVLAQDNTIVVNVKAVVENTVASDTTVGKINDAALQIIVQDMVAAMNANDTSIDVLIEVVCDDPAMDEIENKITYEVHPIATAYANGDAINSVEINNNDLAENASFTITLPVPDALVGATNRVKVTHYSEDDQYDTEVDYYTVQGTAGNYYVTFTVTHFSQFELAIDDLGASGSAEFGASLFLEDAILINFYASNLKDGYGNTESDPSRFKVVYTFNGVTKEQTLTSAVSNQIVVATCAAKELTDVVTIDVYYDDVLIREITYSAQIYCERQITKNENSKLVDLCYALLNYGAQAQLRFNYKTGNLANAAYGVAGNYTFSDVPDNYPVYVAYRAGITNLGASLSLESKTEVNIYFTPEIYYGLTDYRVYVNDVLVEGAEVAETNNGMIRVTIPGVVAKDLGTEMQIRINAYESNLVEMCYSPMGYAYRNQNNVTEMGVCVALYNFYLAAQAYFG